MWTSFGNSGQAVSILSLNTYQNSASLLNTISNLAYTNLGPGHDIAGAINYMQTAAFSSSQVSPLSLSLSFYLSYFT